jgi:formylglycine-generating enzyme required for sulfatase activity
MTEDRKKRLEQLRKAREAGILDEDTYRAAMAGLGSLVEARGERSTAAGPYGTAIGTVEGDVYIGERPREGDDSSALTIYRQVLAERLRHLPLRAIDPRACDPGGKQRPIDLDQVYVGLDTTIQLPGAEPDKLPTTEKRGRTSSMIEAVSGNTRVVLLGDPGSGKSTFLNHLGLCLSLHALDPKGGWLERLPGWRSEDGDLLPVHVVLRDFARTLPTSPGGADARHLWDFIEARLRAQKLDFAAKPITKLLESGNAIVLLDGLDEVPSDSQREYVRDAVAAIAGRFRESRFIVTCRALSYEEGRWRLEGWPDFRIAPFDQEKIDRFIRAWYGALERLGVIEGSAAADLTRRLEEAVRRGDIARLAPNPLLLTVMALVNTHEGRLPEARALLYEKTVDILLLRWDEARALGDGEGPALRKLLQEAGRMEMDLQNALGKIAFEAHGRSSGAGSDALADIAEVDLQDALAGLHPQRSLDWASRVIAAMRHRAGLLLERARHVYTFPHRTFQEYLAGAHLASQAGFAQQADRLAGEGSYWRSAILLAVGRLVYVARDTDKPLALAGELCPERAVDREIAWRKAWLAGEVLEEIGIRRAEDSALGKDLLARVRGRLAGVLRESKLSPAERAAAGNTLAKLGDPRFRSDAWNLPDEPLLGFVEVPGGKFRMGEGQEAHEVDLPAFYMARYPVTVAQFRAFVEASGIKPGDPDCLRGNPNHPVVWVDWPEAVAYCRWLTERLREWEGTPEPLGTLLKRKGWTIVLPSEAEWEKAARGTDGRRFPWGEEPDPDRANYDDTGIGATSAVGCFPKGASPYGIEDMSGNVWEWTRSLYEKYPYDPKDGRETIDASSESRRALRGGAFNYFLDLVRCTVRHWLEPDYCYWDFGFRVVASPLSSGL